MTIRELLTSVRDRLNGVPQGSGPGANDYSQDDADAGSTARAPEAVWTPARHIEQRDEPRLRDQQGGGNV